MDILHNRNAPTERQHVIYVLLLIVALSALGTVLAFNQQRLLSVTIVSIVFGVGYTYWGFLRTKSVPDELVSPDDMTLIWTGLSLVVAGLVLFAVKLYMDIRQSMPRK